MPEGRTAEGPTDGLRRRWRSRRFVVRDRSMLPAFFPGDRLRVDPRPGRPLVRGDVVAVRDPEAPGRLLLKRIAAVGGETAPDGSTVPKNALFVVGDRAERSRDSRAFGPVDRDAVVGVVWFRYLPEGRRGPVATNGLK